MPRKHILPERNLLPLLVLEVSNIPDSVCLQRDSENVNLQTAKVNASERYVIITVTLTVCIVIQNKQTSEISDITRLILQDQYRNRKE